MQPTAKMALGFLGRPNLRLTQATSGSARPTMEVTAATDKSRKKTEPISQLPGIWAKARGSVSKMRPGPIFGSSPKRNTMGKIIKPASSATQVSIRIIRTETPAIGTDLGR